MKLPGVPPDKALHMVAGALLYVPVAALGAWATGDAVRGVVFGTCAAYAVGLGREWWQQHHGGTADPMDTAATVAGAGLAALGALPWGVT